MTSLVEPCSGSTRGFLYLCFLISILVLPGLAERKFYEWEVEYMHWSPDCIESVVMAINGRFPGPEIRAHVGDTIVVRLHNKLSTEGVVIHWHGITQVGTPWADGTALISQCPINPGETFVYEFKVDKAGTYFYHGHFGMQRAAGLYGSLIVEERVSAKVPFHYDGEFNLLLSDWWHQSTHKQEVDLSGKPFRFIGEPQTLLINGKGQYNCALAKSVPSSNPQCKTSPQCTPEMLQVEPNKIYRLRVASTTSLSSLNLKIADHEMLVVEADGNYVQQFPVDDLDIYSGESYSVLLKTDQDPTKNYWISLSVRGREPKTDPALAVLNYSPGTYPESLPPVAPLWNDYNHSKAFVNKVKANTTITPKPPRFSHRRITLLNTQTKINGYLRWSINGISLALPSTPYLGSIKYGLTNTFDQKPPPDTYPDSYDIMSPEDDPNSGLGSGVYKLQHRTVIDVILQNANMLNVSNHSEIHPWHLHGHDFWVLGYGEGKFTKKDEKNFNLKDPPLKNTVSIFPHGWTALRFNADNPGVWAFHCHIEPHLHMGMGVIFAEGPQFIKRMKVPNEAMTCGHTAKLLMNHHHHHHHPHHRP